MKNLLKLAIASILVAGYSQLFAGEGQDLYKSKCEYCHATGIGGTPIVGNKEQWAPRLAKGIDALIETTLKGSRVNPVMMPKGGHNDLTDVQVKEIVNYMVSSSI